MMKSPTLALIAVASALLATLSHAAILGPYTVDPATLHLWHFDESSGASVTSDSAGSINPSAQNGATLGNAGFTGFGNAGNTSAASNSIIRSSVVSPGPVVAPVGAGGAFTYEAMINISTTSGSQHIFSMDADANSNRIFWLRVINGDVQFYNLREGSLNSYTTPIPTTGDDAFVAGEWFHVAATYNGNENTTDNLKLYWTRVDATRTEANLIGSHTMADDLSTTAQAIYGLGNDFRTVGSGNQGNLEGSIDEVRISGIARAADEMLFAAPENFLYHDSATTDGGEFSGNFVIENLKNGGYTSASALEDADAGAVNLSYATTNGPAGGYPVTITLEFDGLASLEAFHLWNHSNVGSEPATNQGVKDFTLTFYDAPGGTGGTIGLPVNASAAKAPATGTYAAESFAFGTTYTGVRSVVMTADNHNPGSGFIAMREIGFTGTTTPIPPIPPANPDRLIVYLVGGQSNADGYGVTSELSAELQSPQPDIDFYHGNGGGNSPLTANQVIRLQPGSGSMGGNAGGFGPELSFGVDIHEALGSEGARIVIIKHTVGGTSLHTDWFPGGDATTTGDGSIYQDFQSTVSGGLAALAALYPAATLQIEGLIWHQGESDAGNATDAGNYQTNLTNFIADVRATYGDIKFGIARLSDNQTALDPTHRTTVKAAQAAVADADPKNYLVTTDDVPVVGTIHFGTAGNLTIGSRLAAGMQEVPITDDDGNGLDDDWEELYWGVGNTGQDPDGDDDKDGLSNLEEFLWLTHPLVSNVVAPQLQTTPDLSITWPSSPDRRYLIEASLDLQTWQRLDSFIPGDAGASTSHLLPAAAGEPHRFFRIGVHR